MSLNVRDVVSIKEKRTFVCKMMCTCGGMFSVDSEDITSTLFSSILKSVQGETVKYKHKCTNCGASKEFENMYPLEKSFEIGLDTDNDTISKFVAVEFQKTIQNDVDKQLED